MSGGGIPQTLLQLDVAPLSPDDRFSNVLNRLSLTVKLLGQQRLLDANVATCTVIVNVTVEQTAVTEPGIAIAIAGLLSEHFGDLLRNTIRMCNVRSGET